MDASLRFVKYMKCRCLLVMSVGLNVIGGSKAPAFVVAASLMCTIYALGNVSGANFNPAVFLCLAITGREKRFYQSRKVL